MDQLFHLNNIHCIRYLVAKISKSVGIMHHTSLYKYKNVMTLFYSFTYPYLNLYINKFISIFKPL